MADTKVIKINARSATIVEGKSRAPNRSMYYAMGYQESDFKKPMVGVANGHNDVLLKEARRRIAELEKQVSVLTG